jgi:hypothetical protein
MQKICDRDPAEQRPLDAVVHGATPRLQPLAGAANRMPILECTVEPARAIARFVRRRGDAARMPLDLCQNAEKPV